MPSTPLRLNPLPLPPHHCTQILLRRRLGTTASSADCERFPRLPTSRANQPSTLLRQHRQPPCPKAPWLHCPKTPAPKTRGVSCAGPCRPRRPLVPLPRPRLPRRHPKRPITRSTDPSPLCSSSLSTASRCPRPATATGKPSVLRRPLRPSPAVRRRHLTVTRTLSCTAVPRRRPRSPPSPANPDRLIRRRASWSRR